MPSRQEECGKINNRRNYFDSQQKNPDMAKDVIRAQVESDYAAGKLDSHLVSIEVEETPRPVEQVPGAMEINVNELLGGILPKKKKKRTLAVSDAVKILADEEMDKQIDMDNVYHGGDKKSRTKRNHLYRRDRQDCRKKVRTAAPTFPERAFSAIYCLLWKAVLS